MLAGHEVRVGRAGVHLQQVGAGAEAAAVAGQQHHRDGRVVGRREQRLGGRVVERLVEGVERLGPVEGERADPVAVGDLERHGRTGKRSTVGGRYRDAAGQGGLASRLAVPGRLGARPLRRGGGDPTYRIDGERHWRGIRTPTGPATLLVEPRSADGVVHAEAWGPGADWALESVPGAARRRGRPGRVRAPPPAARRGWRRHHHRRIGRTGLVMEALMPAIIEQKVTGQEAFAGFRMLVHRSASVPRARASSSSSGCSPRPRRVRQVPSWEWLRMHIDPARSRTLVTAARVADALERTVGLPGDEVERRLTSLPGIGVWTAAEVRQRAHGDADAVSFGDYHVAKDVGWAVPGATSTTPRWPSSSSPGARTAAGSSPCSRSPAAPAAPRRPDGAAHPPPGEGHPPLSRRGLTAGRAAIRSSADSRRRPGTMVTRAGRS